MKQSLIFIKSLLIGLLIFCKFIFAQTLSLYFFENKALENNFLIKEKEKEIKILEYSRQYTTEYLKNGIISLSAVYYPSTYYAENIIRYDYGLFAKYKYPIFGERDNIWYKDNNLKSSILEKKAELFAIKQKILYQLRRAYVNYYTSYKVLKELDNILYNLRKLRSIIVERYKKGYGTWSDIIDIDTMISNIENQYTSFYEKKYKSLSEIKVLAVMPSLQEFTPEKPKEFLEQIYLPSVNELYEFAKDNRKDLIQLKKSYQILKDAYLNYGASISESYFSVFGALTNDATVNESISLISGFGLSFDFSFPARFSKTRKFLKLERQNRATRKLTRYKLEENNLLVEIQNAKSNFEIFKNKYIYFKSLTTKVSEKLQILNIRTETGISPNRNYYLLKANYNKNYADALVSMWKSYAEMSIYYFSLLKAIGVRDLPWIFKSYDKTIKDNYALYREDDIIDISTVKIYSYLWKSREFLERKKLKINLLEAYNIGLDGLYISLDGYQIKQFLTNPSKDNSLSKTLKYARKLLMDIEILLGEPTWIYKKNRKKLLDIVKLINIFAEKHKVYPKCIHLDIEPHSLLEYSVNKETLNYEYIKTLKAVKKISKIPICADVSYKYIDELYEQNSLAEAVLKEVDSINVMLYTTRYDKFKEYLGKYKQLQKKYPNKTIVISLSVEKNQPPYISLYHYEKQKLLKFIDTVKKYGFNYVALQDYTSLKEYILPDILKPHRNDKFLAFIENENKENKQIKNKPIQKNIIKEKEAQTTLKPIALEKKDIVIIKLPNANVKSIVWQ